MNYNVVNKAINPSFNNSNITAIKQEFPRLMIPCPIVDGDKFERQSSHYAWVAPETVNSFVQNGEKSLPYLSEIIQNSNNEKQLTETLYILNAMLDNGVQGVDKMYPVLCRLNNTKSPYIQTYLAGVYRKTQVPDAFGPLVKMLIQNSLTPQMASFDPNEEIGGAILSYLNPRFKA